MKTEFKIGDKVYCSRLKCEGVVTNIVDSTYPIQVSYDIYKSFYYYTKDGRYWVKEPITLTVIKQEDKFTAKDARELVKEYIQKEVDKVLEKVKDAASQGSTDFILTDKLEEEVVKELQSRGFSVKNDMKFGWRKISWEKISPFKRFTEEVDTSKYFESLKISDGDWIKILSNDKLRSYDDNYNLSPGRRETPPVIYPHKPEHHSLIDKAFSTTLKKIVLKTFGIEVSLSESGNIVVSAEPNKTNGCLKYNKDWKDLYEAIDDLHDQITKGCDKDCSGS